MLQYQRVFLVHSHADQALAYSISDWLFQAWPDLSVFVTHRGLTEFERIEPHYYLRMIPQANLVLCLVSKPSIVSNAVADELEVAVKASRRILLLVRPSMTAEDTAEIGWIIERWESRYGSAIDLGRADVEEQLFNTIAQALGRSGSSESHTGALATSLAKVRSLPGTAELPLPDMPAISSHAATREDALAWLALLEKATTNSLHAAGIDAGSLPATRFLPSRLALRLLVVPEPQRLGVMLQLRPLIDEGFQSWLLELVNETDDENLRNAFGQMYLLSLRVAA